MIISSINNRNVKIILIKSINFKYIINSDRNQFLYEKLDHICLKTNTIHSRSRFTALTKHLTNNRLPLLKISRHRILIVMNEPNIFKQILSNIHRVVTIIVILFQTLINFRTLSINLRIIALKYNSTFDSNLPTLPCIPILVQISWTRIAIKNAVCPIKNCKAHFAGRGVRINHSNLSPR